MSIEIERSSWGDNSMAASDSAVPSSGQTANEADRGFPHVLQCRVIPTKSRSVATADP